MTIEEAKNLYSDKTNRSLLSGYRDLIKALIAGGFAEPFKNDSYFDALVLTEEMFENSHQKMCLLTGASGDGFLSQLITPLGHALKRIGNSGGTARLLLHASTLPPTIVELEKKYAGTFKSALI